MSHMSALADKEIVSYEKFDSAIQRFEASSSDRWSRVAETAQLQMDGIALRIKDDLTTARNAYEIEVSEPFSDTSINQSLIR